MIMQADHPERPVIVMRYGLLPCRAPEWCLRRYRLIGERSLPHLRSDDHAATNEAETGVVEIVTLEIGDRRAQRARSHERVEDMSVVEEQQQVGCCPVPGVILADDSFAGGRVVRRADP